MATSTLPGHVTPLTDLDAAWRTAGHGPRLLAVRAAAEALAARFEAGPRVLCVRTLPLAELVYPTTFAFWSCARSLAPYVVMVHRALLVQFLAGGRVTTLLFNPSDVEAAARTPFFRGVAAQLGGWGERAFLARNRRKYPTIEAQLATLGVLPADVDLVAFDHFHTQDLRSILGTADGRYAARFPRAKLLAPAVEWRDWDAPHPMQRAWYLADGKSGVSEANVVLTSGDLALGDGVMLLRTPGHTSGNQTLFVNTESGVWGCSENGTTADAWSPLDSRLPGVAAHARANDVDVLLNSNTMEYGADQYTSMVLERTIASRVRRAPAFVQMFPSSEVTPSLLAPGLAPSVVHGAVESGRPQAAARGRVD